jgi:hypothetical protein
MNTYIDPSSENAEPLNRPSPDPQTRAKTASERPTGRRKLTAWYRHGRHVHPRSLTLSRRTQHVIIAATPGVHIRSRKLRPRTISLKAMRVQITTLIENVRIRKRVNRPPRRPAGC